MLKGKAFIIAVFLIILASPAEIFCDFTLDGGIETDRMEWCPAFGAGLDLPQQKLCRGINYSVGYKITVSKKSVYTSAPGTVGGLLVTAALFSQSDEDENDEESEDENDGRGVVFTAGVLLLAVPENITIHFWLTPSIELGLGLHPWGMEYDMDDHSPRFCNGISLAFNWILDTKFLIAPFADFRYVYSAEKPVFNAGVKMGITF
ncbi:MAG: hypothetical protein JW982_09030 [Spirochaetes bacterium]|nr:hypothetical protein [Spirochaetota bacterium]